MRQREELARLLAPLSSVSFESATPAGGPEWLRAGEWQVFVRLPAHAASPGGEELLRFESARGPVSVKRLGDGRVWLPFDLDEAYRNYIYELAAAAHGGRALSSGQLAAFYRVKRLVPRRVQLAARRRLVRWQGSPRFPRWPLDLSVAKLVGFYARCLALASGRDELTFKWFWPAPYSAAFILTHDVESAQGLRLALQVADLEEERDLRSSFNIVANSYPIDWVAVNELRARGFEIGVHGVHHDRSLFSSREAFEAQQPALEQARESFQAVGFRSPATYRDHQLLPKLPFAYDGSVPHSDPYEPQPGGCCSLWPFFEGDVVELPYTLPQDHTLFTLLQERTSAVWTRQLDEIERLHGLAQVLTHPDVGYLADREKRAIYVELLDAAADRASLWKPLPRDVAAWWRRRDSGTELEGEAATACVTVDGLTEPLRGVAIQRLADGATDEARRAANDTFQ